MWVKFSTSTSPGTQTTSISDRVSSNSGSGAANNRIGVVSKASKSSRAKETTYSVASMLSSWRTRSTWMLTRPEGFRATKTGGGTS
jgi:hypothetical protein